MANLTQLLTSKAEVRPQAAFFLFTHSSLVYVGFWLFMGTRLLAFVLESWGIVITDGWDHRGLLRTPGPGPW